MNLKFGFNVYEKPVEDYFGYAEAHDLRHLEIDLIKDHSILQSFTPKRIDRLRETCERTGVVLSFHAPYTLNLAERISFIRKSNVAYLKKCLSVAHQINAAHVTCHLGSFNGMAAWPWLRKQMLETVAQSLVEILESCREWKVPLALENAISLKEGMEIYFLGDRADDFEAIFHAVPSEWIGFCLDVGHANTNEGSLAYIERLGSKLINVHFHDNTGVHDDHLDVGAGTVPWKEVAGALKALAYEGPFVSECFKMAPHAAAETFREFYGGGINT